MHTINARTVTLALLVVAMAAPASAGPEWDNDLSVADAGDAVATAQNVLGNINDPLQYIQGHLEGNLGPGGGDFQDIYRIYIPVPSAFSATVIGPPTPNGFSDFDTQMWLFDESGLGILGNNNATTLTSFSAFPLGGAPTDGGLGLLTGGFYLIGISGAGSVPFSTGGELFDFTMGPTEVSSADGTGFASPLSFWGAAAGDFGRYTIQFEGAFFVPAPGALGLFVVAFVGRRRRS